MALVSTQDMLSHAYHNGYAVGAFDIDSLECLEGVLAAAERCHSPVILSLAESYFKDSHTELIVPAVETAAQQASVPVAIHLAPTKSYNIAVRAINSGCHGISLDMTRDRLSDNIDKSRALVNMAHACGVPVEGVLSDTSDSQEEFDQSSNNITSPAHEEIINYAYQTEVDFLTVPIQSRQDHRESEAKLDLQHIKNINQKLKIPLVIHRDREISEDQYKRLIRNGVAKINSGATLTEIADNCMKESGHVASHLTCTELRKTIKAAVSTEVECCMHLWGSTDRAKQVLNECNPWLPVEHLIIYNVTNITEHATEAMMVAGKKILRDIPGVREVITGRAIKQDAQYQYTWLVRFCHPAVIDSYREHPAHVSFADTLFRPVALERISIDYQAR